MSKDTNAKWWAAAAGIGLLTTSADLSSSAISPLAPYLLAATIGLVKAPNRFAPLAILLGIGILLPGLVHADDWSQWLVRFVAVGCLGGVAWLVGSMQNETLYPTDTDDLADTDDPAEIDDKAKTSMRGSAARLLSQNELEAEDERDLPDPDHRGSDTAIEDDVNAALSRLRSRGSFTDQQLQWIELELRRLRNPEAALELSALQAGTQVGRYTIEQQLSQGGEGNVFRGRDTGTGESVAIKILRSRKLNDRFRREMELVQRLAHPNIVTAYEVGEHQGVPFIAMELLEGPDLDVYVNRNGPLNWPDSLRYIMQITQGLLHAHHRKLIHRDIKPANVLISGGGTVKLVDLGLAVITQSKGDSPNKFQTKAGNLAGTVPFMAPEQARSLELANAQSDIYGIGSTWFYLLTGKPRLPGSSLRKQLNYLLVSKKFNRLPDGCLPDPFIPIYQRIVAYEPQDRYASCDELLVDLERALTDVGESVPATTISVLVIEDSKTDMILTIETLRRSNQSLKIYQAASLAEGIEVFHESRIDLVLLDLTLPDSNGIETVRRFREAAAEVPLVVLSGQSQAEVGDSCRQAVANEFLAKSDLTVHKMERIIFITHSRAARIDLPSS